MNIRISGTNKLTPEYRTWQGMNSRCHNPNQDSYRYYGARGISVCEAWRHNFAAFLGYIGFRPSALHSIDRKNNALGYQPGNVRWATKIEQSRNLDKAVLFEFLGERRTIAECAKLIGINKDTLRYRISRAGWTMESAISTPVQPGWNRHKDVKGKFVRHALSV